MDQHCVKLCMYIISFISPDGTIIIIFILQMKKLSVSTPRAHRNGTKSYMPTWKASLTLGLAAVTSQRQKQKLEAKVPPEQFQERNSLFGIIGSEGRTGKKTAAYFCVAGTTHPQPFCWTLSCINVFKDLS